MEVRIRTVLVADIDPDPDQPRKETVEEEIRQLAASIRERDLLQLPIVYVVGNRFLLADGHRRLAAIRLLGRTKVPVIVLTSKPDAAVLLETQLTANCLRRDLTPIEKAQAIQRLKTLRNFSNIEVAKALHISESSVTQCLSHLTLSADVQADIAGGKIASSTAYAIARADDEETKQSLMQAAREGTLSRDDALRAVSKRGSLRAKAVRITCRLPDVTVTMCSESSISLQEIQVICQKLMRSCRRAAKQGLDVATFERVLADQSRVSI